MPLPFTSSSKSSSQSSSRPRFKWNLLRSHVADSSKPTDSALQVLSVPASLTDQISTEIYELIIDHLNTDKLALLACSLVCRSWLPRSKCHLLALRVCCPVPLVSHGGFGAVTCAVPCGQ
ncbi:hypothetical protein B0H10DRAFT_1064880 [Mycena sp. CBHHK59/15]|nr:hypothetical protein B0H10DRAFT_1064880 [Mycena sp. CBHHK59/15]